ncbi:MAG: hypothetical protein KKA07_09985 [Bacteroidetes bacterium]|nr:hypothetical protein [Bacteroidota bacterium]
MANGKDLELLERFTSALDKSGNVGATEIGPDSRVNLHVMPDRVIEAVRARILDLQRSIIDIRESIQDAQIGMRNPGSVHIHWLVSILSPKKFLNDTVQIHYNKQEVESLLSCHISDCHSEINELSTLIKRYEEIILRLLEVCIR